MIDTGERISLLKRAFGECELDRSGSNFAFRCPNCKPDKEKRKLVIKIDTGQWHCWVCESKGKSISFLLKKYSSSSMYEEWCSKFEKEARHSYIDDAKQEEQKVELPDGLTIDELSESRDPDAKSIIKYLDSRNISLDEAYRYRIIGSISGSLRRRIIIPSFDANGELNYWTARSTEKDARFRYINPKVNRKSIIFNEIDINWNKEVTLVEGPFDMFVAGENSIPLLGSTLSMDSLLLQRIVENKTKITIALDRDAIQKSHKIAKQLYQFNIDVKFIEMPDSRDAGDMSHSEFKSLREKAYSWNPLDRLIQKIHNISSGSLF